MFHEEKGGLRSERIEEDRRVSETTEWRKKGRLSIFTKER